MLMTHAPCTSYLSFYMLFVMVNKSLFCENCAVFVLFKKTDMQHRFPIPALLAEFSKMWLT